MIAEAQKRGDLYSLSHAVTLVLPTLAEDDPDRAEYSLGYRFDEAYRGQGYATEAGWALVNYLYKNHREGFAGFMRLIAKREDDRGVRVPIDDKLQQMEEGMRLSDYERALVLQTYGFIYAQQEQYTQALDYFERCIALDALPLKAQ